MPLPPPLNGRTLEQRRNLTGREIPAVPVRLDKKEAIYRYPTLIVGQRARPMHGCLPIAVFLGLDTGVRNVEGAPTLSTSSSKFP